MTKATESNFLVLHRRIMGDFLLFFIVTVVHVTIKDTL